MISSDAGGESSRRTSASCDSGTPVIRRIRCSSTPARASTSRTTPTPTAASHIGRSSPGGPGSTTTHGPPSTGTTSPGAVPTGSSTTAPEGTSACLRLPARRLSSLTSRQRPRSAEMIPQIRSSSPASSSRETPANSATTSAVRSSAVGPSPPLVITRSQSERNSQGVKQIRATVPHHHHMRQRHPQPAQALAEPRAVLVADDPGQDLGPGDHDAGADAHDEQSGRCSSDSRRGRRPGRSS